MLTRSTTDNVTDVSPAVVNTSVFTMNLAVLSKAKAETAAQRQQWPGLSSRGR